jgi:hypothetical protein
MSCSTPPAVVTKVGREQHGYPLNKAICPWCGKRGPTEPHHWLLKRSDRPPEKLLHQPINVVLLHPWCHDLHGQTETMTLLCFLHKAGFLTTLSGRPYDVLAWLNSSAGQLSHQPILPKEIYTYEQKTS